MRCETKLGETFQMDWRFIKVVDDADNEYQPPALCCSVTIAVTCSICRVKTGCENTKAVVFFWYNTSAWWEQC